MGCGNALFIVFDYTPDMANTYQNYSKHFKKNKLNPNNKINSESKP